MPLSIVTECGGELAVDLMETQGGGALASDDDQVGWGLEGMLASAKKLSHQSADSVACRGTADLSARRYTQSRWRRVALPDEYDKVSRDATVGLSLQGKEFVTLTQAVAAREALSGRGSSRQSIHDGCFGGIVTVRRLRPLSRRRFSTFRPLGVCILARKPCVRFRRRLLGW